MAQESIEDLPSSDDHLTTVTKDFELSINRLERMLDWLLLVRENVASLNLDLYATFKPIERLQESAQTLQNDAKIVCPLHPDCDRIVNIVRSNLNKIIDKDKNEEKL